MHKNIGKCLAGLLILLAVHTEAAQPAQNSSTPEKEPLSARYIVSVGSTHVPVYLARVCKLTPEQRQTLG